ncbi:hypothetical protein ASPWEDRAFT_49720 [Aspergillus wentii DTO 134E9]|uniref:F-box domain-containing protein n=1 Tax=Aspergillus wentii DTO 134E9 TaxID=1073089 RepID=A0A1L9RY96_ASPWE|nr:uncharacterized protein ASPWEDRAFT_49720 [Aspergillus wentii DTO 134E9]KAI9931478.1 hypothetical protein MW887_010053 [Aspergillus wentii]OJJ39854.1 hypothetical protein ASPWEDRAFT_49720 [Aspergillus wentii DTO 134E9]
MAPSQRSSRASHPVRSSRTKVQSYHEDSSSEDHPNDSESDEGHSRRLSLSLRPRSSNRMPPTYREESTDGEVNEEPLDEDDENITVPTEQEPHHAQAFPEPSNSRRVPPRARRNRTVKTRSQTKRSKRSLNKSHLELGRPLSKRKKVEVVETTFVGSGVIPPWQDLPYHILFDIFLRASHPLVDEETFSRHSSVQWLVSVALICRSFHEPALAALYRCPPLIPITKSHGLLNLLSQPPETLSTNYANKIKELHVDVENLLLYKGGPLGYFELSRLVERSPQVKRMRLYHQQDYVAGLPPWQIVRSKWNYPESLFTSINSTSIVLRSWDWNSRFMDTKQLLPVILGKHLLPAFHGLRELRLLHVSSEDFEIEQGDEVSNEREVVLAMALKELPELHRIEFLDCSIVNEHLLPNLPSTLTSLTINNCDEVTTSSLGAFLTSHGQTLRELNLSHNRHLSMSFMVTLGQSCKQLEKLKIDISIHDSSPYHDVEPHFGELIGSSEIPTWPATLQDIELIQLRKWDDTTAEVFFTSLMDAASELRDLRRLVISAILKIGWRDRATFREKWIGRLEKVFLRRTTPPDSTLFTIPRDPPQPEPDPLEAAEKTIAEDTAQSDAQHSGPSTPSKRKSARIAQRKFSEVEDDSYLSASSSRAPNGDDADKQALTIQGMCDVVMIRIDNQRPTETQFNEQDFLDEEASGDEDWDGNDWDVADGGHAW